MMNTSLIMGRNPQPFVPFPCVCQETCVPITEVIGHGRTLVLDAALPEKKHSALGHICKCNPPRNIDYGAWLGLTSWSLGTLTR